MKKKKVTKKEDLAFSDNANLIDISDLNTDETKIYLLVMDSLAASTNGSGRVYYKELLEMFNFYFRSQKHKEGTLNKFKDLKFSEKLVKDAKLNISKNNINIPIFEKISSKDGYLEFILDERFVVYFFVPQLLKEKLERCNFTPLDFLKSAFPMELGATLGDIEMIESIDEIMNSTR